MEQKQGILERAAWAKAGRLETAPGVWRAEVSLIRCLVKVTKGLADVPTGLDCSLQLIINEREPRYCCEGVLPMWLKYWSVEIK